MNEPYEFEIDGNEVDAKNFIHRMRVALSQIRDELRNRGKTPRKFKVLNKSVVHNPRTGKSKITLVMCKSALDVVVDEIDDTFNSISE